MIKNFIKFFINCKNLRKVTSADEYEEITNKAMSAYQLCINIGVPKKEALVQMNRFLEKNL